MNISRIFNTLFKPLLEILPENNRLERIWLIAKVDFNKRYNENGLGLLWALINPLFRLLLFYVVFVVFFEYDIPNFHLYFFSGLIIWLFFVESTKKSLNILGSKKYIYENIRINKVDLFIGSCLAVSIGFLFNFCAYIAITYITGVHLTLYALFFPLLFINLFIVVLGINLMLSTINIYVKDVNNFWDLVVFAGFWISPILLRGDKIVEYIPVLPYINPVHGLINNFRAVMFEGTSPDWYWFAYNFLTALVLLVISYYFFKKYSTKSTEKL